MATCYRAGRQQQQGAGIDVVFRLIKYQLLVYVLILLMAAAVFAPIDSRDTPELKSGDVLFQTSTAAPSLAFVLLSQTFYDNVGILVHHKGRQYVLQAGEKVDFIPYDDWVAQGLGRRISVWRHEKMVESDITQMMLAIKPYFHQPYDQLLQEDNALLYSSEMVYVLYRAAGLNIGYPQTIQELVGENILTRSLSERVQPVYPECESKSADECLQVLLMQKVITPLSLTQSPGMKRIYSNYLGGLL